MKTPVQTEYQPGPDGVMDVRSLACSIKHGLIIQTWVDLRVGDHFVLVNNHDPVPIYHQFCAHWPEAFTWEYLANRPDECRIKITKLKALAPVPAFETGSGCGGH